MGAATEDLRLRFYGRRRWRAIGQTSQQPPQWSCEAIVCRFLHSSKYLFNQSSILKETSYFNIDLFYEPSGVEPEVISDGCNAYRADIRVGLRLLGQFPSLVQLHFGIDITETLRDSFDGSIFTDSWCGHVISTWKYGTGQSGLCQILECLKELNFIVRINEVDIAISCFDPVHCPLQRWNPTYPIRCVKITKAEKTMLKEYLLQPEDLNISGYCGISKPVSMSHFDLCVRPPTVAYLSEFKGALVTQNI